MSASTHTVTRRLAITALLLVMAPTAHCDLVLARSEAGIFSRDQAGREIVVPASRVEGKVGVKFGITYAVEGKQEGSNPVTYLYLTPGYTEPGGNRRDKIVLSRDLGAGANTHTMAFEFSETSEITYGDWTMMVFEGDRLIVRAAFDVVIPEEPLD